MPAAIVERPTTDWFAPMAEKAEYVSFHDRNMNNWRCGTAWDIRPRYDSIRIGGTIELPPPVPRQPLPKLKVALIRSSTTVNISLVLATSHAAHCFERSASTSVVVWLRTKPNGDTTAFYVASQSTSDDFVGCVRRSAEWIDVNQETPVGTEIVVGFDRAP